MTTTTGTTPGSAADIDQHVRDAILTAGLHPDYANVDKLHGELDRARPTGYLTQAASLRAVVGLLIEAYASSDPEVLRRRMTVAAEYWEATSLGDPDGEES